MHAKNHYFSMKKSDFTYLTPFTLNFRQKKDEIDFEKVAKSQFITFISIFMCSPILMASLDLILNFTSLHYIVKIVIIIVLSSWFIYVQCAKKQLSRKRKIILEVGMCVLILLWILVQIEAFIPKMIEDESLEMKTRFNPERMNGYSWALVFFGMMFQSILSSGFYGNCRWWLALFANFIPIIRVVERMMERQEFALNFNLLYLHLLIPLILIIVMSYLKEKSLKLFFISSKRSEENLQSFEVLIEKIIPNQIFILSCLEKKILYKNRKTRELFEDANDEMTLENFKKVEIQEENNVSLTDIYCRLFDLHNSHFESNETNFKSFDGIYQLDREGEKINFNLDIKIGFFKWKNEEAILIFFNDITSKLKAQKLKEINDYKDMLLASLSHDLRTPLNSTLGHLEVLKEKLKAKENLEYLAIAYKSSQILSFMINDILDFSQITFKKLKINKEFTNVLSFMNNNVALDIIRYQANKKNLKFQIILPEKLKNLRIEIDPRRVQQILLNLLENAIKFTFYGEIKLIISKENCTFHDFNHEILVFQVFDSGTGIKKDDLQFLFDFFCKPEQTDSFSRDAFGFGLMISQILAKIMHEEGISVKSQFGKGSEFRFSIPIDECNFNKCNENTCISLEVKDSFPSTNDAEMMISKEKSEPKIIKIKPINQEMTDRKLRAPVLIVDDDIFSTEVLKNYLNCLNIKYESAFNGVEALKIIEEKAASQIYFSMVFLDCNMPILNGFLTAQKINEMIISNVIPPLPIIATTANVTVSDMEDCRKSGMNHFISKPISKQKFNDKIDEILRNK